MANIIDKSLHFGLQNFIIVAQDESPVDYNYYGYQNKKGVALLMKYKKDGTELRYYVSVLEFAVVWAGRLGYAYLLPSELADPVI